MLPGVDENTLEWFDILGKALMFAAAAMLVLGVIGAVAVATSSSDIELVGQFQQQNRGTFAAGVLGAGIAAAGVLAGLGAILRLLVARQRAGE
jgi:hypothetical protein